jgi:hypothetical protein
MSLAQKLYAMQASIDELKAKVAELERLLPPIALQSPIVSSTIAPPPRKRGRPPKA